jgi:hypothetical protein
MQASTPRNEKGNTSDDHSTALAGISAGSKVGLLDTDGDPDG